MKTNENKDPMGHIELGLKESKIGPSWDQQTAPSMGAPVASTDESIAGPAFDASGIAHPSMGGAITGLTESNIGPSWTEQTHPGMGKK